ncbi:polysaccharide biosynthesis protein [Nocardia harenae]|uniref:polysaccharide biosynthesis protein n=1 Tax=Nocardia harenae TaxID=358707 RepID=UPI000ABD4EE4|nr:polysaccharide biosynthesis protein [Nocardia harenae]
MVANAAGYLLQLLAGRWLGAAGYSEFASLLAVQLLCAVPALALQNVIARELVRGAPVAALRATRTRCAVIVAALAALLVPVVSVALDIGALACTAALVAAPALVLVSGEQGILQGQRRFRALAVVLGCTGIARVIPALTVLALGAGAAAALTAAALGLAAAAAYARYTARSGVKAARAATSPARTGDSAACGATTAAVAAIPTAGAAVSALGDRRTAVRERTAGVTAVLRAAQVQAALMALSSADLILARIVLDEADAGRYALGTIATKIAFWLPQAVGVVLYPRMAQPAQSARAIRDALAVLSGIGVAAVAGAALAAPLAPIFAGADYAPVQNLLWLFALHGAILAVLQGALLSAIAVDRTAPAALTWVGLAAEVVLMATLAHSVPALVTVAACTATVTTALVAAVVLRTAARRGTT